MLVKALLFFIAINLAFLQATILPINLLLLLVILIAIYQPKFSFLFAFLSGLISDLAAGATLGISSLKFLLVALVTFLLKNRLPIGEKRQLQLPTI